MTAVTHPLPPGPHHPHNCGCHHCDEWRKHRTRAMAAERAETEQLRLEVS